MYYFLKFEIKENKDVNGPSSQDNQESTKTSVPSGDENGSSS